MGLKQASNLQMLAVELVTPPSRRLSSALQGRLAGLEKSWCVLSSHLPQQPSHQDGQTDRQADKDTYSPRGLRWDLGHWCLCPAMGSSHTAHAKVGKVGGHRELLSPVGAWMVTHTCTCAHIVTTQDTQVCPFTVLRRSHGQSLKPIYFFSKIDLPKNKPLVFLSHPPFRNYLSTIFSRKSHLFPFCFPLVLCPGV